MSKDETKLNVLSYYHEENIHLKSINKELVSLLQKCAGCYGLSIDLHREIAEVIRKAGE